MPTHIKPHQLIQKLSIMADKRADGLSLSEFVKGSDLANKLIPKILTSTIGRKYALSKKDILPIAYLWGKVLNDTPGYFSSLDILKEIYGEHEDLIKRLDDIIRLLDRQILYTSKKRIVHSMETRETVKRIRYSKVNLLEESISLNNKFLADLVGESMHDEKTDDKPYLGNKDYLADWFTYVEKLYDLRNYYDFKDIRFDEDIEGSSANDMLDVQRWHDRIQSRISGTDEIFPLQDIAEEYALDDNEKTMLVYLVKEDLSGSNVDTDELLKLVSPDPHSLYNNRRYLSMDATLVKRGLIEMNENVFMRSRGSEVRVTPDIMKQVILDTPINDDERLNQILKGNEIFTLIDPNYTMDDLILQPELKDTILTAISRYHQNVDSVLASWNLYDGRMDIVGQVKTKTEPGLLMLLHGPSGTGKTFASGAIARHLGKKLLITDISRLQSMWVGESEKNVKRLFTIFERIVRRVENPPVLLLNEADQFLATRMTDTKGSVDQMNNTLQNIFLEGFERLRGVMIATTNLQENMDSAFSRRFHLKLELPVPAKSERERLWELHLPLSIPRASDVNIGTLASSYNLSGGQIKIIVQNAATEAASRIGRTRVIKQRDLLKYCMIEVGNGNINQSNPIGFACA